MSGHWYDPALYGWLPGTLLGVTGGLLGGLIGLQASRGKIPRSTVRLVLAMLIASAVLFVGGLAALALNQPRGVWHSLLHPGSLGSTVAGIMLVVIGRVRGKFSTTS